MDKQIRAIIQEVFMDLEAACAEVGEHLDAENLADCVGDRMCDISKEYLAIPYAQRRAIVLQICKEYA